MEGLSTPFRVQGVGSGFKLRVLSSESEPNLQQKTWPTRPGVPDEATGLVACTVQRDRMGM